MPDNDRLLVEQAREHPEAFGRLYDRYVDRIYRYAVRLVQDDAVAQDVTAVTFEKALRHLDRFRDGSFLAWLYTIARNEAMSAHRRQKWLAPLHALTGGSDRRGTETAVARHERRHQLYQALARLSAKDRDLIVLRFFEGLDSGEVADIVGCTPGALYVRLHRALDRLRQQLTLLDAQLEVLTHVEEI